MMKDATYGQRFVAAIVDIAIIGIVYLIISMIVKGALAVETPTVLIELLQSFEDQVIDAQEYLERLAHLQETDADVIAYQNAQTTISIINFVSFTILFTLYLIVLPLVWKSQTLGRFLMKIKVVDEGSDITSTSTIIIREFVGTLLITGVLSCCCCIPLIINLVIMSRGKSIQDAVSRSQVVSTIYKVEEETNSFEDFIDAEVKEKDEDFKL